MITRYPILEFLSKAAGTYVSNDKMFELEIRKNGYDFVLLTKGGANRSQIYGVIGVAGEKLEMHASVGLPNIIVFTWPYALEEIKENQIIKFTEQDSGMSITFNFKTKSLNFMLEIDNKEKAAYELYKA